MSAGPSRPAADSIPAGFNARTRVHEYGGGAFAWYGDAAVFANFADQALYRCVPGGNPVRLTHEAGVRHADLVFDAGRSRLLAVQEDHRQAGEAVNTIAAVSLEDGRSRVLVEGNDFYAAPRLSPDGNRLAWLTWNHPDMPWDAAELWMAPVRGDGTLGPASRVAGGPREAIAQPEWSPDGLLYFVSDRNDWWNLCRWRDGNVEALTDLEAEFALPHWQFGESLYAFDGPGRLVCAYLQGGTAHLALLDLASRRLTPLAVPYTTLRSVRADRGQVLFIGGAPTRADAVVRLDLASGQAVELCRASRLEIDADYLSAPEPVTFPTTNGQTAHGLFSRPRNRDFRGPPNERPPLLVFVHGGPTAAASAGLSLTTQYFTSRGFAVLDVNYGGSTGYGRAYRERLYGTWGIVDVDDCCNGAAHLAQRGLVDPQRLAIAGGSAGGYTTLAALTFRSVFAAGSSRYGVSDCEVLAQETHKFEARYLDRLIGPYPAARQVYLDRSPIRHLDRFRTPVIFLQGSEDVIVPPNQAQSMVAALRGKGVPVAYIEFPGEQHGFRQAANIARALEAELYFFARIFGFTPADAIAPVPIENLGGA